MKNMDSRNLYELSKITENYYEKILECQGREHVNEINKLVEELLEYQKEDGSFRVMVDEKCDSDIRVAYIFFPTYYATAALIYADLHLPMGLGKQKRECLLRGLKYATQRRLVGHGFSATEELIKALRLYQKAGMYRWIFKNKDQAPEFFDVIKEHFYEFVTGVAQGRTYSDWNRNFELEFCKEIHDYEEECISYIWYVVYGNNLCEECFVHQLQQCKDTTFPEKVIPYELPYEIFFGGKSKEYKSPMAYFDRKYEGRCMAKMYLLKKSQFDDIRKNRDPFYTEKIILGMMDGNPIYTFSARVEKKEHKAPTEEYLKSMRKGLIELYPDKSPIAIELYLYTREFLTMEALSILSYLRDCNCGVWVEDIIKQLCFSKTKILKILKELSTCGLICLDSKSKIKRVNHCNAIVRINREKKDLIDVLGVMGNY